MSNLTNITYGTYDFQRDFGPVPLLDISKTINHNEAGEIINCLYSVSIKGEINLIPSGIVGYANVGQRQNLLISGFSQDYQDFEVKCGNITLIKQKPMIKSITFSPSTDNWSETADYSIELEWYGEELYNSNYSLDTASETWDLALDTQSKYYSLNLPNNTGDNNMYLFSLSHNVSAKGSKKANQIPWQEARRWVVSRLGFQTGEVSSSGVFNLNAISFSGWNHSRTQQKSEQEGTFGVQETWLVANTGLQNNAGAAIEDFTTSISYDIQEDLTSVSINGSVQGLEQVSYGSSPTGYSILRSTYENASGYWLNIKPKLWGRACALSENYNLNPIPLNYNIGYNPTKGSISYTYSFNDRPCNLVTGSLSESITVNDTNPVDVFAEVVILGRKKGPILQSQGTVTSSKRNVNIEVTFPKATVCSVTGAVLQKPTSEVNVILCELYKQISGVGVQIYKNNDSESWDFKKGKYSRNVEWTYVPCTGQPPNTSFC